MPPFTNFRQSGYCSETSKCRNLILNLTIKCLHTSVLYDLMSGTIYRTQGYNLNL